MAALTTTTLEASLWLGRNVHALSMVVKPPRHGRGFCSKHYQRMKNRGSVCDAHFTPRGACKDWLRQHASYSADGCLTWPFSRNKEGYGNFGSGRFSTVASREMCYLAHGEPASSEMQAAHTCGNGHLGCVNPRHLYWATPVENARDTKVAGRKTPNFGERHFRAKLTDDLVREIRRRAASGEQGKALAKEYGMGMTAVYSVINGETWKHVR